MNNIELRPNQKEILKLYRSPDFIAGTVLGAVRSGKTLPTLIFINEMKDKHPYNKILWLAYDTHERDEDLKEKCYKWGFNDLYDNYIEVIVPHSLFKITALEPRLRNIYSCIVFNECHKINPNYYNHLKDILLTNVIGKTYFKFIGLTGTYPHYDKRKMKLLKNLSLTEKYKYTVEEGIDDEVVADYNVTVVEVPLDSDNNIEVTYKDKRTGQNRSFMTSEVKSYKYSNQKIAQAEANEKNTFNLKIFRMNSLNRFKSKLKVARILLKVFKNKRYLLLASTHDDAASLTNYIYDSKTDDVNRDRFLKEEIPHLALLNKGSTGATYENLDGCILLSVNRSNSNVEQKIGRTFLFRPDYIADVIILISKDTVQKRYVLTALKERDKDRIRFIDWDDYKKELADKIRNKELA